MTATYGFGVDIGGTGIKGAPVDLRKGRLSSDRRQIETPHPATPEAIASVVGDIVRHFDWRGPVGITLPAVVKQGVAHSAANIDPSWIGTDAATLFAKQLGLDVDDSVLVNDADAAGIAEVQYSHPESKNGVTLLVTFGTGIGSALFLDGKLVPNTELGHVEIDGRDAEPFAAASAKDDEGLSYPEWAERVNRYLGVLERLVNPDRIIVGGGVSKAAEKWVPLLRTHSTLLVATRQNNAGIVGAALAGMQGFEP